MQPAISIQNLSKKYKLATTNSYVALRDVLTNAAKNFFHSQKEKSRTFWALRDINLEIGEGERIGILGHNGAGKSTLLKIISRITPPTTGKVVLNGRVASLLEVGTGFHPELTGRENIYLNGSILGLKKKEIDRRLDEIIDFSGVEKFIDAPLKQYSSGMQLRLAFSVAAHLEAEILLIDEVLAVGDLEFQKKCIGKMEEVSTQKGKTIVFVSHNFFHLRNFCQSCVLLKNGHIITKDKVESVLQKYSNNLNQVTTGYWAASDQNKSSGFIQISLVDENGKEICEPVNTEQTVFANISLRSQERILNSLVSIRITNSENIAILTSTNADEHLKFPVLEKGNHCYQIPIPFNYFIPGRYSFIFSWNIPNVIELDSLKGVLSIEVTNTLYPGEYLQDGRLGVIHRTINWKKM